MTLVEYGELEIKLIKSKPELIIACTASISILKKISKIKDINVNMVMTKDCKVFIDIPKELLE